MVIFHSYVSLPEGTLVGGAISPSWKMMEWKSMGFGLHPFFMKWKITFMFETTNQIIVHALRIPLLTIIETVYWYKPTLARDLYLKICMILGTVPVHPVQKWGAFSLHEHPTSSLLMWKWVGHQSLGPMPPRAAHGIMANLGLYVRLDILGYPVCFYYAKWVLYKPV
jgi:hypothetical protein